MLFLPFIFLISSTENYVNSKTVFDNKFIEIRNKNTFVDKTLLIEEFLQHKYLFVNAPSKFGKSTNLDMISLFLGNHRTKEEIEKYFSGTKIYDRQVFFKQHIGEHPIVHFNLKVVGSPTTLENILTAFKVSLYNAISDHMYLFDSEKLSEDQLKMLETYADLTNCRLMDPDTVKMGLHFLVEVLHHHHGKPVILLADEFGRGITEGIIQNKKDLLVIVEWYSSVLNNTFSNENIISHALLSGENWIYGVHSPVISKFELVPFMQRVEFTTFFGFTQDEVKNLLTKVNQPQKFEEVIKWYGGYSSSDGLFKMVNPFSINEYFAYNMKESVYWSGSSLASELIGIMVGEDSLKKQVVNLVLRNTAEVDLKKDIGIDDVVLLKNKVEQLPHYCENFFLRVLIEAGYLTFSISQPGEKTTVKVVNEEVQSAMVSYTL